MFRKFLCWLGWHSNIFYKEECHCNDMLSYWRMHGVVTICCNSNGYHYRSKCKYCGKEAVD